MTNSISKKNIRLLLYVFGVLILILVLASVRPQIQEKTDALTSENQQLSSQLQTLVNLEMNESTYIEQSKTYETEIASILEKYPAEVREEDAIIFAKEIEDMSELKINTIGIAPGNLLLSLRSANAEPAVTTDTAATDTTDAATTVSTGVDLGIMEPTDVVCPDYYLYNMTVSYDFTSDYEDLKKVFAKILADEDKRNISAMSLTFDSENGLLVGNINMNLFYMMGTEKEYVAPDPGVVLTGNDNIFGTMTKPRED